MDITQEISLFRESIRHLWNTYLRQDADWNTAGTYRNICRMLFDEQIIARHKLKAPPIPVDEEGDYISGYKIIPKGTGKLPLFVNRDIPPSGYWDHPIDWIPPEQDHDIRPISFFDFDVLGWRMIEFYHVKIIKCCSHSELTGRDALIRCDYVSIEASQ